MPDNITIEVLEDGTIKMTTGRISGPNHMNADALLKSVSLALGGETTIKHRGAHDHAHAHAEQGHHHEH